MKILFAASECTPFVKTGGLADVIGTLPNALARSGADVRVILPKYRDIPRAWKDQMTHLLFFYVNLGWRKQYVGIDTLTRNGVTYYFVDNEFYFARDSVYGSGNEEGERFGYFCRAVLEAVSHIGFRPDVLHCHDWQTGMIPMLLNTQYRQNTYYRDIRTVFTIHNLRFQGVYPWIYIDDLLGIGEKYFTPEYLEYYGGISFMKAAVVFADRVTTVSPTYALEIQNAYYGERLDGLIRQHKHKLSGILNGIDTDEYDPQTDRYIAAHFSAEDLSGKAVCKRAMQEELMLEERPDTPLIAMIARLTDQKGLDLIECVLDDIMRGDIQLVVLGKGEERYGELLSWAAWRYQGRMAACIELNEPLAHRLYAAADIFLMPSQFEPCGLSQMISMRYGTVPVVRETGGLHDSVTPYNKYADEGNGFSFANYNAHEMLFTLERAVDYYRDKPLWTRMMRRAMATDFSWDQSAVQYLELYAKLAGAVTAAEAKPAEAGGQDAKPAGKTRADKPAEKQREEKAECAPTPQNQPEALPVSPEGSPEELEQALRGPAAGEPTVPDQAATELLDQPCLVQVVESGPKKRGKKAKDKDAADADAPKKKAAKADNAEPKEQAAQGEPAAKEPKKRSKKAEKTQ